MSIRDKRAPGPATIPARDYDLAKLTRVINDGPGFDTLARIHGAGHVGVDRLLDVWARLALESCEVKA